MSKIITGGKDYRYYELERDIKGYGKVGDIICAYNDNINDIPHNSRLKFIPKDSEKVKLFERERAKRTLKYELRREIGLSEDRVKKIMKKYFTKQMIIENLHKLEECEQELINQVWVSKKVETKSKPKKSNKGKMVSGGKK